jgi:hypothetical protein
LNLFLKFFEVAGNPGIRELKDCAQCLLFYSVLHVRPITCMATTRIPVESGLRVGGGGGRVIIRLCSVLISVTSFIYVYSLGNLGSGKIPGSSVFPDGNRKFPKSFVCPLDGNRQSFQSFFVR